ncbi:hypothetical protein FQA39_LY07122 [Lamprigera yunnana]|nr:hypothetical protein FQA39_LY07122 [Lamprigera yunnana]
MKVSRKSFKIFSCLLCRNVLKSATYICVPCGKRFEIVRNSAIANIKGDFTFACSNKDDGCSFRTTAAELMQHEEFCDYSLTQCKLKLNDCNWFGTKKEFENHSLRVHPTNSVFTSKQTFLWQLPNFNSSCRILMKAFDRQFLCLWFFVNSEDINLSVAHLGPTAETTNYYFTITFHGKENSQGAITFKRPCHFVKKCETLEEEVYSYINLSKSLDDYIGCKEFYYTIALYNYNISEEEFFQVEAPKLDELTADAISPEWKAIGIRKFAL